MQTGPRVAGPKGLDRSNGSPPRPSCSLPPVRSRQPRPGQQRLKPSCSRCCRLPCLRGGRRPRFSDKLRTWTRTLSRSLLPVGLFQHGPDGACQENAAQGPEAPWQGLSLQLNLPVSSHPRGEKQTLLLCESAGPRELASRVREGAGRSSRSQSPARDLQTRHPKPGPLVGVGGLAALP